MIKRILLATCHLVKTGGTENYSYALATELKSKGYDIEYFAFECGEVAEMMEKAGIPYMSHAYYDLIIANHTNVIKELHDKGYTIQTCHGIIHDLEQPSPFADAHVSITNEVKDYLKEKGYESVVIPNGIDCQRFRPFNPISEKLSCVLSLCQSDKANRFIEDCCKELGVKFLVANKFTDNIWKIEDLINQADIVIGIGRSLYDAMACGRCVISYDYRQYMGKALGDGFLDENNIKRSFYNNCSGRGLNRTFTKEEFLEELGKYNKANGEWARQYALENHNISTIAEKYLALSDEKKSRAKLESILTENRNLCSRQAETIAEQKSLIEKLSRLRCTHLMEDCKLTEENISTRQCQILSAEKSALASRLDYIERKNKKHLRQVKGLIILSIILLISLIISMIL